jgi:glycerol-3-phosphate dehydrogenase (NAD+)
LISKSIENLLGIDVSVLMGANIANEVAEGKFCEATLGYSNKENALILKDLFHSKDFKINLLNEVAGVEICGATKNIVALGAGFSDGLKLGSNTKSTIIRLGLEEMKKFTKLFFKDSSDEVYFESCGIADLITTCYGGRNYKVSVQFAQTNKTMDELEAEILNGQKLQGTLTLKEVVEILKSRNVLSDFPLFKTLFEIVFEKNSVKDFISILQGNLSKKSKL